MDKIESEILETLDLLKPGRILKTDEFYYTRLEAKIDGINKERIPDDKFSFGFLKPALIIFTILINIFSAFYFLKSNENENNIRSENYSKMAKEYNFNINNFINTNSN